MQPSHRSQIARLSSLLALANGGLRANCVNKGPNIRMRITAEKTNMNPSPILQRLFTFGSPHPASADQRPVLVILDAKRVATESTDPRDDALAEIVESFEEPGARRRSQSGLAATILPLQFLRLDRLGSERGTALRTRAPGELLQV